MSDEPLHCPGCGHQLQVGQVDGLRQYTCVGCRGVVMTIAVLRQLEGAMAIKLWTEDPSPVGDGRLCPFCSKPMVAKAVASGTADICRPCEAVWLDSDAVSALPGKQAPAAPSLESQALHCDQCGAPIGSSLQDKCQYCGATLHAPTQVVVLQAEPDQGWGQGSGRHSILGSLLGEATNRWP